MTGKTSVTEAPSYKLMPLCPMDVQFQHIVNDLLTLLTAKKTNGGIGKHQHRRITAWIIKLSEPTRLIAWKKNRNLYASVLLGMLAKGELRRPFDMMPCGGALPTMPSWMKMHAAKGNAAKKKRPRYIEDDTGDCEGEHAEAREWREGNSAGTLLHSHAQPLTCETPPSSPTRKQKQQRTPRTPTRASDEKKVTFSSPRSDTLLQTHRLERQLREEQMGLEELRVTLEKESFRLNEWQERCENAERWAALREQESSVHAQSLQDLVQYTAEWQQRVESLVQQY